MARIFISAGHSTNPRRDRGAVGSGYVEGVEAAAFRQLVVRSLRERYGIEAVADADDSVLSDTIRNFQRLTSPGCIVIDIHFNASSNPRATGTESFVPRNSDPVERGIASRISQATANILRIPLRGEHMGLRGVKCELNTHHGARGLGFMRLPGHNVLTEICFITNQYDMAGYAAFRQQLADAYADILKDYIFWKTHIVRAGETLWGISRRYGITIDQLKNINNLRSTVLQPGQVLSVKP